MPHVGRQKLVKRVKRILFHAMDELDSLNYALNEFSDEAQIDAKSLLPYLDRAEEDVLMAMSLIHQFAGVKFRRRPGSPEADPPE